MTINRIPTFKNTALELLERCGITVNGSQPWDIQVHDERFYTRAMLNGSLGLGESYVDGLWDVERIDEFILRLLRQRLNYEVQPWTVKLIEARARLANLQTRSRATQVAEVHYNLDNDFYQAMLDDHMAYSCGYWEYADNLQQAQDHKLELICRKLGLEPGMRVLDIGCGWGSFVRYAASRYGIEAVGINISTEQVKLARERCRDLPVTIRLQDYRDIDEPFDRIVSVGMFEHVGHKNYAEYMQVVHRCLKPDGLFLLHTIGQMNTDFNADPWIERYIFPNSELPSMKQIAKASEGLFVIEDIHNFGADYDPTLMAWHGNFEKSWPRFRDRFDERFYRMWRYYLLSCAASSRARQMQVWQLVLSPEGVPGGYRRPSPIR